MGDFTSLPGPVRAPNYPLETFRIDKEPFVVVRTISERYWGLFTHYKGRSQYCPGAKCSCPLSRLPRVWKGYCAAERWMEEQRFWLPCNFEMTENLELFMRGLYARGQVWQIRKVRREGRKHDSIEGQLLESLDPKTLPYGFDIKTCLQRLYHCTDIDPTHANPTPPRAFAVPSKDYIPPHVKEAEAVQLASAEEVRKVAAEFKDRLKNFGTSPEIRNGKH